jgi:hypothetical protein
MSRMPRRSSRDPVLEGSRYREVSRGEGRVSTEAQERIQAQAGPVTDKALEEIIFRAEQGVVQSLAPYPRAQRVALLPSVVRCC